MWERAGPKKKKAAERSDSERKRLEFRPCVVCNGVDTSKD